MPLDAPIRYSSMLTHALKLTVQRRPHRVNRGRLGIKGNGYNVAVPGRRIARLISNGSVVALAVSRGRRSSLVGNRSSTRLGVTTSSCHG